VCIDWACACRTSCKYAVATCWRYFVNPIIPRLIIWGLHRFSGAGRCDLQSNLCFNLCLSKWFSFCKHKSSKHIRCNRNYVQCQWKRRRQPKLCLI